MDINLKSSLCVWGIRDGAVVRTRVVHQCGLGSIPGVDAIFGLALLLVLSLAPEVFLRVHLQIQNSTRSQVDEEPFCGCATSK